MNNFALCLPMRTFALVPLLLILAMLAAASLPAHAATPRPGSHKLVSEPARDPVIEVVSFGMTRSRGSIQSLTPRDVMYSPETVSGGTELYQTAETIGLPESMVDNIVKILSGEIDFHHDLEQGFKCTVLFEMGFSEGQIGMPGRILAVRLDTSTRSHAAYLFQGGDGRSAYYGEDGKTVSSSVLQSPILFSRITSGFTVRRFHPILNTWRAHQGIDYAAPAGTPVRSTSAGTVEFAGMRGAYGNLVVLQHANGFTTRYGHLQSLAPGLRSGQKVEQGEVIGKVGMTGLATGPHLHYELRKFGQALDPGLAGTPTRPLAGNQKISFENQKHLIGLQMAGVWRTHFVQR